MDLFNLSDKDREYLLEMPDEEIQKISLSSPWQFDKEPDGDSGSYHSKSTKDLSIKELQDECWDKTLRNPWIGTSVRRMMGRLTGFGFKTTSDIFEIQEAINEIWFDPRNRLYNNMPKYEARSEIEGELFLCFTCHLDGFIEVDFVDPSCITGGKDDTGIIYHPRKTQMPLMYQLNYEDEDNGFANPETQEQIPSIYIARYPELINVANKSQYFNAKLQKNSKSSSAKFKKFNGFYRFLVNWDKSYLTERAFSHLRTVLEWTNYYENLKKYELDHKKSSGSYLWVFQINEPRTFKQWLAMSDEDRAKTGIMAKKTPGGSLVLPPGIDLKVMNPTLPKMSGEDTDILSMVSSGLNTSQDDLTGSLESTYASAKSSKSTATDRVMDEIAYFERFMKYDFWGNLFWLKSKISSFPEFFRVKQAVKFTKEGEPIFKNVKKRPEELIAVSFPISSDIDLDAISKSLLGVKHGDINSTLGIPRAEISRKLGFADYGSLRLEKATEDDKYPELILTMDAESVQESNEAEPSRANVAKRQGDVEKDVGSKPTEQRKQGDDTKPIRKPETSSKKD